MSPALTFVPILLAALLALTFALGWGIAGRVARRWPPDPACTPADLGLPTERVTFQAEDGVEIGGWWTHGPDAPRPTVIFAPGLFGSLDGDTHLVPEFVTAGFDVLQFDWRAHGVSGGDRPTLGVREIDDLRAALDFLAAWGVERVGLLGFSMGGAVALRVAAADPRVACVIADGPLVRVEAAFEGAFRERLGRPLPLVARLLARLLEWRLGVRLGEASPLPHVGAISPRPVLFIHGADDPFVPPTDQDALYAACGPPKALWRVEGAGHREAQQRAPDEYRERVIGFFGQHLAVGD